MSVLVFLFFFDFNVSSKTLEGELLRREGGKAVFMRLHNSCSKAVKLISALRVVAAVTSSTVQGLKENSTNEEFPVSGPTVFCHILLSNATKSAKFVTHVHAGYCVCT